ncbi:MAG: PhoH family protein [Clostridia bacterium]|nr:PhoH family protein [Clostridia bacterium]
MKVTKEKFFKSYDSMITVFGELDSTVKRIEEAFSVVVFTGSQSFNICGEEINVMNAVRALDALETLSSREPLKANMVNMVIEYTLAGKSFDANDLLSTVCITSRGKIIRPKSFGQKEYVDAIQNNSIVFGVGPAGTGKTYLAVAMAVSAFKNKQIDRIILTRPAVEAGEKLGFLPGDLQEKVDPYLRPLFDALQEMMGEDAYLKQIEKGTIEIAPLAYMRGRTLSNAFIILDEAQNTTCEQMKMFLTRMGENSKIVVNGDITQIDLPRHIKSGLKDATEVLSDVDGIKIVEFSSKDVVRHELVTKIIKAYEKAEKARIKDADAGAEEI